MTNEQHAPGPLYSKGKFTSNTKETCANMHCVYDAKTNIIALFDSKEDANLFAVAGELLAALEECVNQLATNDMQGSKVYQHLTNERRNMLTAALVVGRKVIDKAKGDL